MRIVGMLRLCQIVAASLASDITSWYGRITSHTHILQDRRVYYCIIFTLQAGIFQGKINICR